MDFRRFATWSNIFYLVPLAAAAYYEIWWVAVAVLALFIFSLAFHLSLERRFVAADIFAGLVVAICGGILLYLSDFESFYTTVTLGLVAAGLAIRYGFERGNRGGIYHGLWHLVAAAAILTCVLSYI